MSQGKFLAKALYDNVAETPDELAFRRGDVLTVVEQDPGGLEGWWLCSLRGKTGIAPGNRLKIVSGMGDNSGGGGATSGGLGAGISGSMSDVNLSMDESNKTVVLGMSYDQAGVNREDYDVPRASSNSHHRSSLQSPGASSAAYNKRPSQGSIGSVGSIGNLKVSGGGSSGHLFYDTPPSHHNHNNRGSRETDDGIYDTPPSSKRTSCERTPPPSNRSSASRDSTGSSNYLVPNSSLNQSQQSLNQLPNVSSTTNGLPATFTLDDVRRRRSASKLSDNCYETPPGSNRSSNRSSIERILSEEGPPIYESLSPATSLERIANQNQTRINKQQQQQDNDDDATYDTLPVRNHVLSNANPASQTSLHSTASNESFLSNTSGASGSRLSQTTSASLPDSARSSMDIPTDTYDVPPQSQNLDRSRKQLSMDSGLGFYDSPTKSRPTSSTSSNATSFSQQIDDVTTASSKLSSADGKSNQFQRSKSLEDSLDDDLYDTPKNNTLKANSKLAPRAASYGSSCTLDNTDSSGGVYDVPPQVTRDSVISNKSDSSDENLRLSSSSFELDPNKMGLLSLWDELLLDYDSALEVLVKRQQDVSKAASRLSGFVTSTWRSRASLEKTLYDIKVSCSMVQKCLIEFVDFAQGSIANASKSSDMQLANRLYKYVAPLQNTLELVNKSFSNLEEMKWQVALLGEPSDKSKPDDLGQIALVSKDLMVDVKRVASFIQSNGQHLFRKASVVDAKRSVSSKPPIVPSKSGNGYGYAKLKSVQQRPLPAVPIPEKQRSPAVTSAATPPANLTPVVDKVENNDPRNKMNMYAIKESFHKDDYAECDELFEDRGGHDNDGGDAERDQGGQEYDYVQLDDNNTLTRSSNTRTGKDHDKSKVKEEEEEGKVKTEKSDGNQKDLKESKDVENVYSKINNEELEIKTSELSLDDKTVYEKPPEVNSKSVDLKHDDVDMIPVKESSTLERPKDKNQSQIEADISEIMNNIIQTEPSVPAATEKSTAPATTVEPSSNADIVENETEEQDEKTPVNISSLDTTNFPLPDVNTPTIPTDGAPPAGFDETAITFEPEQLDPNDHQVLVHYAEQMNSHSTLLANSIDAFIGAVGSSQPPNVFISHSKFVIVSAHKLVHIGDTVHRNLASNAISARVMHSANHLCDCLKSSVNATKMAALQYPSPVAIQEMVDKVIAVSHAAHQLKFIMTQAHRQ